MGRVIRISAVLMGVLLVGLAGGLKWARSEERVDILVLWEGEHTPSRLSWLYPNAPRLTPFVTNVENIMVIGTSSNGEWFYFMGGGKNNYDGDIWIGSLYRVRVGGIPEVVVSDVDGRQITKSPNNEWIIYPQTLQSPNGSIVIQFIRLELATAKKQVLKTFKTLKDVYVSRDWSYNPEWIKFRLDCWDWRNSCTEYIRFRADGTTFERTPYYRPYEIEADGARLVDIAQDGYTILYWRETDGELRPVTPDWTALGLMGADVHQWLPDEQILIIYLFPGDFYWAVRPNDLNPIWRINDNVFPLRVYPESGWVLYRRDWTDRTLWRMRLDGRDLIQLVPTDVYPDWQVESSGNWVDYEVAGGEWRRVSMDGEHDEFIYKTLGSNGYTDYWGRSPQEQWFIVVDGNSIKERAIYRIRQDRQVTEQLTPKLVDLGMAHDQYSIVWMTAPASKWNYLRLTLLGGICLGLPIIWRGVRRYLKKTPLHQAL